MTDANVDGDGAMDGDDGVDDLRDRLDGERFPDGTFNDWIGLRVEEEGEGRVVLSVDCERDKQNPGGVMHGGVTATLIDVAGGMAIGTALDGEDRMMATTNLDVNYLRPITDRAYATAEVVRIGSTTGIARVDVESTAPSGERKRVAIGTVTYQRE